jgi:hypothetical protein
MLLIGQQRQRTCQGFTRREFLQAGGSSLLGLSLADLLKLRGQGSLAGSARSVIMIWLWGGPSHLDMWDPKPAAPLEYRGPYSPIATRTTGIRISELFPQTAQVIDRCAIVRSLYTTSNDHGVAGTIGLTGSSAGAVDLGGRAQAGGVRPAVGAVVARARGLRGSLPPFMVVGGRLHQGKKAIVGEGGGPFGASYDPFRLEYDPRHGTRIPALRLPADLNPERLGDRQRLIDTFDQLQTQADLNDAARSLDDHRRQAFAMLTSPGSMRSFDLSQEADTVRDRYGRTRFGQSCLLARRLIEHGVPFVQVNWSDHVEPEEDAGDGGWDNHYRHFQVLQDRQAGLFDRTFATLIGDLQERGLLQRTLVLAIGEFGRTPKINNNAGRDHWEHCYSALLAGGGIAGGRVVGASDPRGERPHDLPATPADIAASIYHAIGIGSEQAQTLNLPITGRVIEQLF